MARNARTSTNRKAALIHQAGSSERVGGADASAEEVRSANDRAREIQQPDRIQTEPQDTGDVGIAGQLAENCAGRPENPCDVRTNGERRAPR